MAHFFDNIEELPPDPIFGLTAEFKTDPRKEKFTFITGYFLDKNLKVPVLESVFQVEKTLLEQRNSKEYLPVEGDQEFVYLLENLIFGTHNERIVGFQTVGGTGALFLIGKLACLWTSQIALSQPTWINHWKIFSYAGLETKSYSYLNGGNMDFSQIKKEFLDLPAKSCVLLHTSCHNPTGLDFSQEQWHDIASLCEKKGLFPILDMAYQGFGTSLEEDAFPARLFLQKGFNFALTYTCAKNFSLYGERAGALFIIGEKLQNIKNIKSQILGIIRSHYSNPPVHGACLVKGVLKDASLTHTWNIELEKMRIRMKKVREDFIAKMTLKNPRGKWEKFKNGKGLFIYSGISKKQGEVLRKEKGFYIAEDGRINLTGINDSNLELFTDAIAQCT